MAENVKVTIKNDVISAIIKKLEKPIDFYRFLGARLKQESDARFMKGIDPDGRPWENDSPITWASKKNPKIMIETPVMLMKSIKANATSKGLLFGTNLVYGKSHQLGLTIKAKKKWLWIPLTYKAKRALISKTMIKGLFPIKSKNGNLLMVKSNTQKMGSYQSIGGKSKGAKIRTLELWFLLKKSIKMPIRKFIGIPSHKTVVESLKEWIGL